MNYMEIGVSVLRDNFESLISRLLSDFSYVVEFLTYLIFLD